MTPLETYIRELHDIRSSGAAVKETSSYGPLASLFNEIGKSLKPKVKCIINLQNRGAGLPDGDARGDRLAQGRVARLLQPGCRSQRARLVSR